MESFPTFQFVRPHFDALARVGYYKIVPKPLSRLKCRLHGLYRVVTWVVVITYNLQHLIAAVQARHSVDQVVNILFILLTILNALGKQIAFNARSQRVDRLISQIDGPIFAATNPYHVEVMKKDALMMSRLLKLYHGAIYTCGTLWLIYPIVNKVLGEPIQFTGYFPFDTTPLLPFAIAQAYMSIFITFQGYGNVTMDCTIVAMFSLAKTQIQMVRHNIEQLVNVDIKTKINAKLIATEHRHNGFRDNGDGGVLLQRRLIRCVEHYRQTVGFVKEVESIFGEAMVVQFLIMAWVICMTVYKIANLSILSAEFVSMAVYLGCMLAQLFIYCYFGTQLKVASEFVNQSVYSCGWLLLSPSFRRQLLVLMQYCSRPIAPRTAYVVPMSLDTYITVLRSSYTLFTFLNRK